MMPVLKLGPLSINFPLLVLLAGIWMGFRLIEKKYPSKDIQAEKLIDGLIVILIGAVIGARAAYLLRFPQIFLLAPAGLFSISTELLDPWGGLAVAIIILIRFLQREKIAFLKFLEAILPFGFMMAITFVMISFVQLEGVGTETDMFWGIHQAGASRHPYQLYFFVLMIGVFYVYDFFFKQKRQSEIMVAVSVFLVGLAMVISFGFQADASFLIEGIRTSQIIGLMLTGGGFMLFVKEF